MIAIPNARTPLFLIAGKCRESEPFPPRLAKAEELSSRFRIGLHRKFFLAFSLRHRARRAPGGNVRTQRCLSPVGRTISAMARPLKYFCSAIADCRPLEFMG